jgi:iron complex transport system substrate-binding protein
MKPRTISPHLIFLIIFIIVLLASSCGEKPQEADAGGGSAFYRGRDLPGNEVTLPKPPRRIVSLAPSNTEILFALGAGDRLAAVTEFSDYPSEAAERPRVGDLTGANLERIAAVSPDLVLAGNKIDAETLGLLRKMRIPAAVTEGSNFAETYRSIEEIGRMTGKTEAAAALVKDMRKKAAAIAARAKGASRPLCYYIVSFGDAGNWTAGPGSFIQEMIELAGGRNAGAALGKPWGLFQLEKLVALDPEILIAGKYSGPLGRLTAEPGYSALTAVKRGRLAIVDDDLVGRPGPRLVLGMEQIARAVHPEIFGPLAAPEKAR